MESHLSADQYAKGMVHYTGTGLEATPTLDKWQYSLFRRFLGPKILDVGAGAGRIAELVIKEGRYQELVALEPSTHFFQLLKNNLRSAPCTRLIQAETGQLLADYSNYFDSTYSVHVMEHIQDDRRFLEQMIALTRPGGYIIILVPALPSLYSDLDRNIGHFRRYNKQMMRAMLTGLEVDLERIFYNNFLGVLGSWYFSKIRKINYQKDEASHKRFTRVYHFFSEYVVPCIRGIESVMPVPVGLNLTMVLKKR